MPHALKITANWDLPVGRGKRYGTDFNPWLEGALGNWTFNLIGRVQSGRILTVTGAKLVGMSQNELQDMYTSTPGVLAYQLGVWEVDNAEALARRLQDLRQELMHERGVAAMGGSPPSPGKIRQLRRQIAGWNGEPDDFDFDWDTVAGYLDRLDRGIACNAAYLVPQGTLRLMVVGPDNRPATAVEIAEMARLLRVGLDEGAVGMSSGLTYPPSMFADDDG